MKNTREPQMISLFNDDFSTSYLDPAFLENLPPLSKEMVQKMDSLEDWTSSFHAPFFFYSLDSEFEYYPVCGSPVIQKVEGENAYDVKVEEDTLYNYHFFGYIRCPEFTAEWRYFTLSEIFLNRFVVIARNPLPKVADVWEKHKETRSAFSQCDDRAFLPSFPANTIEQRFLGDAYLDWDHYRKAKAYWFFIQRRYALFFKTLAGFQNPDGQFGGSLSQLIDYLKAHEADYTPQTPQDEDEIAQCDLS
jgi:hypothetical protein